MNELIDIIIPIYNIPSIFIETLCDTLSKQSIIKQCQVYFIDDGSTNGFDELRRRILDFPQIKSNFLINETNYGPGYSRQRAISLGQSPFIKFLDSDDIFISNFVLEELIAHLEEEQLDVLFTYKKTEDARDSKEEDFILRRAALEKTPITMPPIYFHEDMVFLEGLHMWDFKTAELKEYTYLKQANPASLTRTMRSNLESFSHINIGLVYRMKMLISCLNSGHAKSKQAIIERINSIVNQLLHLSYREKLEKKNEIIALSYYFLYIINRYYLNNNLDYYIPEHIHKFYKSPEYNGKNDHIAEILLKKLQNREETVTINQKSRNLGEIEEWWFNQSKKFHIGLGNMIFWKDYYKL